MEEVARELAYTYQFLENKSDEELKTLSNKYSDSHFRIFCIEHRIPVLGSFYLFQRKVLDLEIITRDMARRHEAGEAVCGFTVFS